MMFSARSTPACSAIALRSVRRSLNTPVLAIAQLPVGPASAAIAAHVDSGDGVPRYTLAVRCERSRDVVFFAVGGEELAGSESSLAADAALSLAESMGFVFEEEFTPISGDAATLIWQEFVGAADPVATPAALRPMPLLTKFRRSTAWSAAGAAAVLPSEAVSLGVTGGLEAVSETPAPQIAQPGDR